MIDTLPETVDTNSIEHDLIFAGLVGMIDPERKEAAAAIKVAQSAGIRTIMITGDHRDTAQAIAKRLGILRPDQEDGVLTGGELNDISDEELERTVETYSVYARVSPEHKVRIVKAWQKNGKVVSMTGMELTMLLRLNKPISVLVWGLQVLKFLKVLQTWYLPMITSKQSS